MERKWKGKNWFKFQPYDEFYVAHWFGQVLMISTQDIMLGSSKLTKKAI